MKRSGFLSRRVKPRKRLRVVGHNRIKPRSGARPTASERRYWDSLPNVCASCGTREDIVVHHILAPSPLKRQRRDHLIVAKLCAFHHNMGSSSVHALGSEAAFQRVHGVDLVAIAELRLREAVELEIVQRGWK
jgi:hypothetical protein